MSRECADAFEFGVLGITEAKVAQKPQLKTQPHPENGGRSRISGAPSRTAGALPRIRERFPIFSFWEAFSHSGRRLERFPGAAPDAPGRLPGWEQLPTGELSRGSREALQRSMGVPLEASSAPQNRLSAPVSVRTRRAGFLHLADRTGPREHARRHPSDMVREVKKSGTAATRTTKALQPKAAISIATGGGKFPSLAGREALPDSGSAIGKRSRNPGAPSIFWVSGERATLTIK